MFKEIKTKNSLRSDEFFKSFSPRQIFITTVFGQLLLSDYPLKLMCKLKAEKKGKKNEGKHEKKNK